MLVKGDPGLNGLYSYGKSMFLQTVLLCIVLFCFLTMVISYLWTITYDTLTHILLNGFLGTGKWNTNKHNSFHWKQIFEMSTKSCPFCPGCHMLFVYGHGNSSVATSHFPSLVQDCGITSRGLFQYQNDVLPLQLFPLWRIDGLTTALSL